MPQQLWSLEKVLLKSSFYIGNRTFEKKKHCVHDNEHSEHETNTYNSRTKAIRLKKILLKSNLIFLSNLQSSTNWLQHHEVLKSITKNRNEFQHIYESKFSSSVIFRINQPNNQCHPHLWINRPNNVKEPENYE